MPGELLSLMEAAKILRVSRRTMHRYVSARRLPSVQYSRRGRVLIPRDACEAMIRRCEKQAFK